MTPGRIEPLGTLLAPSGSLLLVDMGMLRYWSHNNIPGDAGDDRDVPCRLGLDFALEGPDAEQAGQRFDRCANPLQIHDVPVGSEPAIEESFRRCVAEHGLDARLRRLETQIPHLSRAQAMLERGGGVVEFHGHWAVAIGDVPPDCELTVLAELMPDDHPLAGRFRRVTLECRPGVSVARSERLGHAWVSTARLGLFDLLSLGSWRHDDSLDGKADVAFWGADEGLVAARLGVTSRVGPEESAPLGWRDLPEHEATVWLGRLEELQAEGLRFVLDHRPHSHHYRLLSQMRSTPTESGTISLGQARASAFFTTWGDGSFEVHRELDIEGRLVRLRVELGTEKSVERFRQAWARAEALGRTALVSRRVIDEGAPARLLYRTQEGRGGFSGWWVWSEDEPEGWGDGDENFVPLRLDDLLRRDPSLASLLETPPRCAFFREELAMPFELLGDFFSDE